MGKQCSKEVSVNARRASRRGGDLWSPSVGTEGICVSPKVDESPPVPAGADVPDSFEGQDKNGELRAVPATAAGAAASPHSPPSRVASLGRILKHLASRPAAHSAGVVQALAGQGAAAQAHHRDGADAPPRAGRAASPRLGGETPGAGSTCAPPAPGSPPCAGGASGALGAGEKGAGGGAGGGSHALLPPQGTSSEAVVVARTESFQQPPHFLEMKQVEELSETFTFYVETFGLKCRNLSLASKSFQAGSRLFCTVRWGDSGFHETTEAVSGSANPKWKAKYHFSWSTPDLSRLHEQALELSVFEVEGAPPTGGAAGAVGASPGARQVLLGRASVDLLTVATGPVHHDLLLSNPAKGKADCGRVIIDVRMAQICPLIINPIEILVNLQEPAPGAGQAIIEEVSDGEEEKTKDEGGAAESPERPCGCTHLARTAPAATPGLQTSAPLACRDEGDTCDIIAPHCHMPSAAHAADGQAAGDAPNAPQEAKSPVMNKELWQQQESERLRAAQAPRAAPAAAEKGGEDATSLRPLSFLDDGGLAEEDEDGDEEAARLRQPASSSSASGHEEEPGPRMAHWQLCFRPTGVKNPAEYFSTWTDKVDQPYWNTVDHSLLTGRCSSALSHQSSFGRQPSFPAGSAAAASASPGARTPDSAPDSESPSRKQAAARGCVPSAQPAAEAGFCPAACGSIGGEKKRVGEPRPADGVSEGAASALAREGGGGAAANGASQPLISCTSRAHYYMDRVDQLGTYQKLAALARKGRLVREVLYDDFPTIQLVTTIDQLRQNHLHIALYSRCFPRDEPKFAGESWLPFFKIYDADVVDQLEKHFFDSYFREKLWLDGRCIGDIEGIIVFQNNPMVRQMYAGVHTERGFMRISPPILGVEHRSVKFAQKARSVPREIQRIAELHKTLLDLLFSKAQHGPQEILLSMGVGGLLAVVGGHRQKPQTPGLAQSGTVSQMVFLSDAKKEQVSTEFQTVCEQLLLLLSTTEAETRRSFIYGSVEALLTAQRVLLNLANHVLEYMDYVLWQHRGLYCSILHHILRRGELDIGTVLPPQSLCCSLVPESRLDLAEVYILYRFIRRSSKLFARSSFGSVSSCAGDEGGRRGGAEGAAAIGENGEEVCGNFGLMKRGIRRRLLGEGRRGGGGGEAEKKGDEKKESLLGEILNNGRDLLLDARLGAVAAKLHKTDGEKNGARTSTRGEEAAASCRSASLTSQQLSGSAGWKRGGSGAEEYCLPGAPEVVKSSEGEEDEDDEDDEEDEEDNDLFGHFLTTAGADSSSIASDGAEQRDDSEKVDAPPKEGEGEGEGEREGEEDLHMQAETAASPLRGDTLLGAPASSRRKEDGARRPRTSTLLLSSAGASLRAALAELGLKAQGGAGGGGDSGSPRSGEPEGGGDMDKEDGEKTVVSGPSLVGSAVEASSGTATLERGVTASDRLRVLAVLARTLTGEKKVQVALHHKRMKICRQYFLLLHRMLCYALNNFCSDAIFEGQKKYISVFLSIAYFRLPSFREELLACLLTEEERELDIEEWRGTEYSLDAASLRRMEKWNRHCELRITLDWGAFHAYLKSYFGEAAVTKWTGRLGDQSAPVPLTWKSQFAQRGALFFSFLEQWCRHVFQSAPSPEALTWQQLPGYAVLLKALLLEMKFRPVTKYPDSLLNSSGAMLANEKLLSVFSKVLFLKTSVYSSPAVFAALNYVDYWMEVLKIRGQELPSSFDFNFLRKGLDIVVASDICVNAAKAVWFVYKNLPLFHREHLRSIVVDLMLHNNFLHLFLNWSWLVRKSFMWFLLYRLCEGARKIVTRTNSVTSANAVAASALLQSITPPSTAPPKKEEENGAQTQQAGTGGEKDRDRESNGASAVAALQAELLMTIRLSPEERVVFQGYMVLASFLKRLNAPLVLPSYATKLIAHILELQRQGQNPTHPSLQPALGRGKFRYNPTPGWSPGTPGGPAERAEKGPAAAGPASEETAEDGGAGSDGDTGAGATPTAVGGEDVEPKDGSETGRANSLGGGEATASDADEGPARHASAGDEASSGSATGAAAPGGAAARPSATPCLRRDSGDKGAAGRSAASLLPPAAGSEIASTTGGVEDVDLRMWAEGLVELPPHLQVYAKIALKEWHAEVSAYREWVMAGASPLPAMHIPASPLDSNTDVPLDS